MGRVALPARMRIPTWLRNKYAVTTLAFLAILTVFDRYNLMVRYQLNRELREAHHTLEYYEQEITELQRQVDELAINDATAEKFARERYLMKRPEEDVFLIPAP
jgi:cell division protein DivIC